MKPTKKQLREVKLLDELQAKHDYLIVKMNHKKERFTTIFKTKGRTTVFVPAITLRLTVPMDSAIGKLIGDIYKADEKPKKPAPKKKRA
jgi:hypothetical protein